MPTYTTGPHGIAGAAVWTHVVRTQTSLAGSGKATITGQTVTITRRTAQTRLFVTTGRKPRSTSGLLYPARIRTV